MRPIALHILTWGTVVGSVACTLWLAAVAGDMPPGPPAARIDAVHPAHLDRRDARIQQAAAESEAAVKR